MASDEGMALSDHDLLVTIAERLENFHRRFDEHLTQTVERQRLTQLGLDALDRRVRTIEEWKWKWMGVVAIGVFVINLLANAFIKPASSEVRTMILNPGPPHP